ncbi:MAG: hypothetical protein AB8G05_24455 [Oligoflexales bacterium]
MYKSIAIILVLILFVSCKISEKYLEIRKINNLNPQSPLVFNDISIELEKLNIAGLQLPRFALTSKIEPHHYEYEICSDTPKASCAKGKYYWGSKIIPGLDSGNYLFKAKACFRSRRQKQPLCSAEVSTKFTQDRHENKVLFELVNMQKDLSDMIREKARDSHILFAEHYESEKEKMVNIHFFNMLVMNHLNLGSQVSGELLNSYAFLLHYERQIEKSKLEHSEKNPENLESENSSGEKLQEVADPPIEEKKEGAESDLIETEDQKKEQVDEQKKDQEDGENDVQTDQNKQSTPIDQSDSDEIQSIIDRIEDLEKTPNGVYPSGAILLSIASAAVLTGIITASLSTASLLFSPTVVNGMEVNIKSGIDRLADSMSEGSSTIPSKDIDSSLKNLESSYKSLQEDVNKYLEILDEGLSKERMEPLLDLVGKKVRAIAHEPLRYVSPMRPEEIAGQEFLEYPEAGKQKIVIENDYFVLRGNQPIEIRFIQYPKLEHTRVFRYIVQKDPALIPKLDEIGKNKIDLKGEALKDETILDKNAVTFNGKKYVKINGSWCFEDKVYQIQGEAVFLERKNGLTYPLPEQLDRFPKLHPETVKALNARQAILARNIQKDQPGTAKWVMDKFKIGNNPGTAWARGIPLFDTDGKLIEPPEKWKLPGRNWFYQFRGVVDPLSDEGFRFTFKNDSITLAEEGDVKIEYKHSDKDNFDKVNPKPAQARVKPWERLYMDELEARLWKVEGDLSNLELEANLQAEEIRSGVKSSSEYVKDKIFGTRSYFSEHIQTLKGDKHKNGSIENHFDKFRKKTRKFHFIGIGLGVALVVSGGAGIASIYAFNLAPSSADKLVKEVAEIEEEIYQLHQKKLQTLFDYKKTINKEALYKPATDHWIYEL